MQGGVTGAGGFLTSPSRIVGELQERVEIASKALRFYQTFLDDCLRGILPNDLVLIGAPSGMGKTDLALAIAATNAAQKKRVHYFALEAEPRELERRTKFALLSREVFRAKHPNASSLNYTDWLLGRCEDICRDFNRPIDQHILEQLGSLWTFYRGTKFDQHDLRAAIEKVHTQTDLIIVDHLHYIDTDTSESEVQGLGETVKTIRDIALNIGKPVILVAHLRKRDPRGKQLVATLDDFHGSSNIVKICTQAITIEAAHGIESSKWYLAPTFMSVQKDRRGGAPRLVALANFDRRTRSYRPEYTLGRLTRGGTEWEPINFNDRPGWAINHRDMEMPNA